MSVCHAVLLDTVSIQDYIFQSNKLKENLGASFMVEELYRSHLKEALYKVFEREFDLDAWKESSSKPSDPEEPFEVGYIGGGNALLFFREPAMATEFIKTWSRALLIHAPGVAAAAALNSFDKKDFKKSRNELLEILTENKRMCISQTVIPRHGFTSECTHDGLSMDNNPGGNPPGYVSGPTNAKIKAAAESRGRINNDPSLKPVLRDAFCFSDELEKLGGLSGEDSHIAIVHIDGNEMGKRFMALDSLEEIRRLSIAVDNATKAAFLHLIEHITDPGRYPKIMAALGFDGKNRVPPMEDEKCVLPIRPIILGGDDVTFVCDGKLGLYFSKFFIEAFEQNSVNGEALSACAGVAVTKTSYPFYRGYRLAEELCGHAKKVRKAENAPHSYIDFHISTGGFSGSLDQIRESNFKTSLGDLIFRPYALGGDKDDPRSFDLFVKNAGALGKFPNNKLKELRQVLTLSRDAAAQFVKETAFRGRSFPEIPGRGYHETLFENSKTPYFDMIELLEYYPDFALDARGGDA